MNWFPNLVGKIHPEAERAITTLFTSVQKTQDNITKVQAQVHNVVHPGASTGSNSFLHQEDIQQIVNAIQASGSSPLNVTGLIGQLSNPQVAKATVTTDSGTPGLPPPAPTAGQFLIQNGQLYYFDTSTLPGKYVPISALATFLYDTYANWTAANYPPANYQTGTIFYISDWNVIYMVQSIASVMTWVYLTGEFTGPYSSLPPNGFNGSPLGTADTGLMFSDNSTYLRSWRWNGTTWKYGPGELPGGDTSPAIMMLAGNSTPPGWHLCDGSTVTITKSDSTTTGFTTPNFQGGYYPKGGTYTGTTVPVLDPILSGSGTTPVQSGTGATPGSSFTPVVTASGEPEHITIPFYIKL